MEHRILQDAINKWGEDAQIAMIQEEAIELSLALHKFRTRGGSIEDVIDELADMKIMLAQAEIMLPKDAVNNRVAYKMKRLKGRLDRSEF